VANTFTIQDDLHSDGAEGEFDSFASALAEVRRLGAILWGTEPNVAPCQNWRNCGRHWTIVETDRSTTPYWTVVKVSSVVEIRNAGVKWFADFQK
jgi:hypothetical protein